MVGLGGVVVWFNNGRPISRAVLSAGDDIAPPELIAADSCPDGSLIALDARRYVWRTDAADAGASNVEWTASPIETSEDVMDIDCAPNGDYWVVGSFATILNSTDMGASWHEYALGDDLIITSVYFLTPEQGVAFGEFGTVLQTVDGGATWLTLPIMPREIYPLTAYIQNEDDWWVGGLDGVILHSEDGGATWRREETEVASPIYRIIEAGGERFALGDFGAVLVQSEDGGAWVQSASSQKVRGYLRAAAITDDGVLVAGGGGSFLFMQIAEKTALEAENIIR